MLERDKHNLNIWFDRDAPERESEWELHVNVLRDGQMKTYDDSD